MALLARERCAAALVRWLGPWSSAVPKRVRRSVLELGRVARGAPMVRAALYEPAQGRPAGAYLVSQGLHYAGADDPRFDRFCRVLAAAGFDVLAPFLNDFLALEVSPRAGDELALGWRALRVRARALGLPAPGVFSISFGSLPALALAAHPEHASEVGGLVVFGGYCDFGAAIRFALSGRAYRAADGARIALCHDPSNAPAVFVNLLPLLDVTGDRAALGRAWHALCRRTWGRKETWADERRRALAEPLALALPIAQRELFWIGAGLRPGGEALLEGALARAPGRFAFADAARYTPGLRCPVAVVHGRDDDVIPWVEAEKLHAALPDRCPKALLYTGMYAHTGATFPQPGALAGEAASLLRVVVAMVDGATGQLGARGGVRDGHAVDSGGGTRGPPDRADNGRRR